MKQLIMIFSFAAAVNLPASSQNIVQPGSPGFDRLRTEITHGKIDSITYHSKTVGTQQAAGII